MPHQSEDASDSNPKAVGSESAIAAWVEVLVDCPGTTEGYLYQVPPEMQVAPGDIVSVPFGAQQMGGLVIRRLASIPSQLEHTSIRLIEEVVGRGFFPPDYWTVLQQVADYYCTPLMQVVRAALPPGLLRRSQRRLRLTAQFDPADERISLTTPAAQAVLALLQQSSTHSYTWQHVQRQVGRSRRGIRELLALGWVESYLEPPKPMRPKQQQAVCLTGQGHTEPSDRQREVLEVLRRQGGEMWLQALLQHCRTSSSVVRALEQKGWVVVEEREVLRRDRNSAVQDDHPPDLTPAQATAVEAITALQTFRPVLLHGVTGSGKTEVYLRAIAPILERGQSALVLVPEIGLTPQLTDRFQARFGKTVQVYHSALSDGERYDTWRHMLTAHPQIIIGTRSAVFAPLHHLGIIILDEEHDTSFKQDQPAPCYHARQVAEWRAIAANCPLVLGSATPALETWHTAHPPDPSANATTLYLSLPERIQSRPMPPIRVIDMREEFRRGHRSIFSRSLQEALQALQERKQQGLLFIHRRGHSTFVSCRSCGHVLTCPHCDISLTYHQPHAQHSPTLRCHYCGYARAYPPQCPECLSPYLKQFGSGTQRVEEELSRHFPTLRSIRFDSDTTRTKGAHRTLLTRFAQGEADLLVGTQMLTKGIDLPQVTLVGIVAADGLLHLADYRAAERAFQVLLQVAGRAGRGQEPGQVILQTYSPLHPVIQAVQRQDYKAFTQEELTGREALRFPPFSRLVLLRISGPQEALVAETATQLAEVLGSLAPDWEQLGPVPAVVARVARRYRWQIMLRGACDDSPGAIAWDEVRSHCPRDVSLTIDVDPLNFW